MSRSSREKPSGVPQETQTEFSKKSGLPHVRQLKERTTWCARPQLLAVISQTTTTHAISARAVIRPITKPIVRFALAGGGGRPGPP